MQNALATVYIVMQSAHVAHGLFSAGTILGASRNLPDIALVCRLSFLTPGSDGSLDSVNLQLYVQSDCVGFFFNCIAPGPALITYIICNLYSRLIDTSLQLSV